MTRSVGLVRFWPQRFFMVMGALACMLFIVLSNFAMQMLSNALMLLMDRANFIPAESSIWTFEPYEINQGSSSYWLHGDTSYYFAYTSENAYRVIAKSNQCAGFDKRDVRTWCTP